jgi:hypothetical protein
MVVLSDEHKEGPVNVWAEHCREHKRRKTNKVETGDDRRGMKMRWDSLELVLGL